MRIHPIATILSLGGALILAFFVLLQANAQTASSTASAAQTENVQAFQVIGIAVRTTNEKEHGGNGEIPKLWQHVMQEDLVDKIPNRADQHLVVVNTNYASDQNGEYDYILGSRVTSAKDVPEGFVAVTIPAGKYAVVESEKGPPQEILPKVWMRIWAMSPAELGGTRAFKADYEVYPAEMNGQDTQVTIYLGLK
jgi:predicted transcriptional regulator YdeE